MTDRAKTTVGVGTALAGVALASLAPATAASAADSCALGATLVSPGICEITFTSGTHTFIPPAGITKLDALVVGAGGGGWSAGYGIAYGGGGGEAKVVSLAETGDVSIVVGAGAAADLNNGHHTSTDSSVTQNSSTTTAQGGSGGDGGNAGISGTGYTGRQWGTQYQASPGGPPIFIGGGGGAGGATTESEGGPGVSVSSLTGASSSLFAGVTTCYGGGGGAASYVRFVGGSDNPEMTYRSSSAVCDAGGITVDVNGSHDFSAFTFAAPRLNSGGGGAAAARWEFDNSVALYQDHSSQAGADGVVILRFTPTIAATPTVLANTGSPAGALRVTSLIGLGAFAVGACALIVTRSRRKQS